MKDILYKYRERLINLSSKNRSLVSMTLPKKRAFDMFRLEEITTGITEKIIQWMVNRDANKMLLLEDPYEFINERKEEINKQILLAQKEEIKSLNEKEIDKEIIEIKISRIKEKYEKILQEELRKIDVYREKIIDFSLSLKALNKEVNDTYKETGRDELYIGYPFVEGKFKDDIFTRAPLFLFPVRLVKNGDRWHVENVTDKPIILNKVFLLGYFKHNEIKSSAIQTEFENMEIDFVPKVIKELKDSNIILNYDDEEILKFKDYKKDNIPQYNLGEIVVKNYIVIGQFSIANSIYNDYIELEGMDIKNELLEKLLKSNSVGVNSGDKKEEHGKLSFSEKDLFLISPLDYSQEKAVKKVNETSQLVIYGPPGTGKSQTIANIIGDALAKNKTVLMVSQKRAALDVIYNRLAELNQKAVLIHDANSSKKDFYSMVADALENGENYYNKNAEEILKTANEIDSKIELLEAIGEMLHSERSFGITLQEMYSKTKGIISRDDERYEEFSNFRKNNEFKDVKYDELKDSIDKIGDEDILAFEKYYDLCNKNRFAKDINPRMNFMDIDELSQKVEEIIKPIESIINSGLEDKETFDGLMMLFKKNNYSLSKDEAEGFGIDLNKKHNSSLLEKINKGQWWSINYWINYSKNKKLEEKNKNEFYLKEKETKGKVVKMYMSIKGAFDDMLIVKKALNEEAYNIVIEELLKGSDLTQYFKDIISALNLIEDYREELITVSSLNRLQHKILTYIFNKKLKDLNEIRKGIELLLEFVILFNILEIEKDEKVLKDLEHIEYFKDIVKDINHGMSVKQKLSKEYILEKWDNKISSLIEDKKFKEFKRQANKKRALLPIRKYLEEYWDMILKVFPCFLLSPETVSEVFPLNEKMFDIVIFDEASQMYVENAIPTIFRGKQVVIAGDDKQLRPTSTFNSRINEDEDEEVDEFENAAALEEESLLDLAKVNYDNVHLNYHYRSAYDDLINFSNYAFYGATLQVSPNLKSISEYGMPIERIMVDGRWINRENQKEAEETVNIIAKLFKERKSKETIGVITFNINQKSLIEELLEKRAQEDKEFKDIYIEEIDRQENNEDVSLFVKNIENVQGDERDIIIFSIAYAKNENGRVSLNFGSLSQDGGENRLNVAISRAKKKIYVITSIEPEELGVDSSKNNGPKLFKKYLQYVREVSNGNKDSAQIILNSVLDSKVERDTDRKHDSEFEAEVYDQLINRGYKVDTQVGVSGYKIDMAIYDTKTSSYILGIECDGATYHSSKSARERDIHRQRYLESRGWKITRIWSKHWWRNPKGEIDKINALIKSLIK